VTYLLALIGLITLAVLLWRAFGPTIMGTGQESRRAVAPDDDPEFLRKLDWETRKQRHTDPNIDGEGPAKTD
jgi:hypothetical protein